MEFERIIINLKLFIICLNIQKYKTQMQFQRVFNKYKIQIYNSSSVINDSTHYTPYSLLLHCKIVRKIQ
jgi:hypothetical protein